MQKIFCNTQHTHQNSVLTQSIKKHNCFENIPSSDSKVLVEIKPYHCSPHISYKCGSVWHNLDFWMPKKTKKKKTLSFNLQIKVRIMYMDNLFNIVHLYSKRIRLQVLLNRPPYTCLHQGLSLLDRDRLTRP